MMAPRTTRPYNRTSAPATRRHGESDPNDPPKKRKTHHSKTNLDDIEVDEREGGSVEVKRGEGKSGRQGKKTGRYVPSPFPALFFTFFSFFFVLSSFFFSFILFHLLITFVYYRKTTLTKNNEVAMFQDTNCPLARSVFFFPLTHLLF